MSIKLLDITWNTLDKIGKSQITEAWLAHWIGKNTKKMICFIHKQLRIICIQLLSSWTVTQLLLLSNCSATNTSQETFPWPLDLEVRRAREGRIIYQQISSMLQNHGVQSLSKTPWQFGDDCKNWRIDQTVWRGKENPFEHDALAVMSSRSLNTTTPNTRSAAWIANFFTIKLWPLMQVA